MIKGLKIISANLLDAYRQQIDFDLQAAFDQLKDAEISTDTFSFYTSVSVITSSRIEGEPMEIDSYLKHKSQMAEYQPNLTQKPDDLYNAYTFAQHNKLNSNNFLFAHKSIAAHLLPTSKQGNLRTGHMVVTEHKTGRIQFEAAPPQQVNGLMTLLWEDIKILKTQALSHLEVFYFAAFIHLVFVDIHPFEDGNGRAGRLLEKWFIAEKLGTKAWYLQSELNYYTNVNDYYKNLNRLGIFYEELDYTKAMPFLLMLPNALKG